MPNRPAAPQGNPAVYFRCMTRKQKFSRTIISYPASKRKREISPRPHPRRKISPVFSESLNFIHKTGGRTPPVFANGSFYFINFLITFLICSQKFFASRLDETGSSSPPGFQSPPGDIGRKTPPGLDWLSPKQLRRGFPLRPLGGQPAETPAEEKSPAKAPPLWENATEPGKPPAHPEIPEADSRFPSNRLK